jgi:putative two-component system response regulator
LLTLIHMLMPLDDAAHQEAFDDSVVLIVDDEKGPRESLRMILAPGHRVVIASDGTEALELLRTQRVDLVTVDLNMPGLKGDELVGIIRDEFPQIEIIIITGFGTLETAVSGIRRGVCDFLTKPFDVVQVTAAVSRALQRQQGRRRLVLFLEGVGSVLGRHRGADEILDEIEESSDLQGRLRSLLEEPVLAQTVPATGCLDERTVEFLELLAETIENRDPGMRGHARRVSFYAGLLAERLCLGRHTQEQTRLAAFVHDLGKLGLYSEALPSDDTLDDEQRKAVEQHPLIGERLFRPLAMPAAIASAVRHHHERWDGAGYPDGLRGDEIPLIARIIAVTDAFDTMVCERPYQTACEHAEALAALKERAGSQFDASLVEAFVALMEKGARAPSDSGQQRAKPDVLAFEEPLVASGSS